MVHEHYFVTKPPTLPLPERVNNECTEQVDVLEAWHRLYYTQLFSWTNMIVYFQILGGCRSMDEFIHACNNRYTQASKRQKLPVSVK